ncbi:MAG: hypothetical protein ACE5KV_01565, partial [Thermoplasmata archaeon]
HRISGHKPLRFLPELRAWSGGGLHKSALKLRIAEESIDENGTTPSFSRFIPSRASVVKVPFLRSVRVLLLSSSEHGVHMICQSNRNFHMGSYDILLL